MSEVQWSAFCASSRVFFRYYSRWHKKQYIVVHSCVGNSEVQLFSILNHTLNFFFFFFKWAVCCSEKMPWEKHWSAVCSKIHQETENKIQSSRSEPGRYWARSWHTERDSTSECDHATWCLWEQNRCHSYSGTVSSSKDLERSNRLFDSLF